MRRFSMLSFEFNRAILQPQFLVTGRGIMRTASPVTSDHEEDDERQEHSRCVTWAPEENTATAEGQIT